MKIIIGLGNPGQKYEKTRHNIGFRVLDKLAEKIQISFTNKDKLKALLGEGTSKDQKVILIKPQTYMNLSGEAVQAILSWYKASVLDMLIVHDDIDLEFGKIRIRDKGRSGGHNGIQSIIQHLGVEVFHRLKIGVNRPPTGWDPADYVLAKFNAEEEVKIPEIIEKAVEQIEEFIKKG